MDSDLAKIVAQLGHPPLWSREPGFGTLIHIILEQQVSLASAKSAFDKLTDATDGNLTPEIFLSFSDSDLKEFGFSRQKAKYSRELSEALVSNKLSLDTLHELDDVDARDIMMSIKGIGPWTANIYMLMALRRPDVWPSGDLAVKKAIEDIKDFNETPSTEEADEIALKWKPWRAMATRILWHHYLSK
jgi:DNA-3-methyladenine glycosylase II